MGSKSEIKRPTRRMLAIAAAGIAVAFATVLGSLTFWQGFFADALVQRNHANFVLAMNIAFAVIASGVVLSFLKDWWLTKWSLALRADLFAALTQKYFDNGRFARLPEGTDSVSTQRMVDDIREWSNDFVQTFYGSVNAIVQVLILGVSLWSVLPSLVVGGIKVPAPMIWFSIILFGLTSAVIYAVGRRMRGIESQRANAEGSLRGRFAQVREYSRSIALLRGSSTERQLVSEGFQMARNATARLALIRAQVSASAFALGPSDIFAWLFLSAFYFNGQITFGQIFQGALAHSAMGGALSWIFAHYEDFVRVRAAQDRIIDFHRSLGEADAGGSALNLGESEVLSTRNVQLIVPTPTREGRVRHIEVRNLSIAAGEKIVIQAPSGFGKSLLFLALSGNWRLGKGDMRVPANAEWVPQRPYFPTGTLLEAIAYPLRNLPSVTQTGDALRRVGLGHLFGSLDKTNDWNGTLSGGELARLGLVRAMLRNPKWLFLDEPTAALDRAAALACMAWVYSFPNITVVAISHQIDTFPAPARVIELASDGGSNQPESLVVAEQEPSS